MRSPIGEVIFGGETMRFSKIFGRTDLKKKKNIYIYILYYRPASFYAKKTKRGWIFTHKEGRLDTFDRVVFLVEMDGVQTPEMQSRQRALPFLTGMTYGMVNLLQSMLHSHSFILTK